MKLDDTVPVQVADLVEWMLAQAELKTPGPPEHAERCLAMKEHAWFLKEIVLPKLEVAGRMAQLSIAEGVNGMSPPARPDSLKRDSNGFLSKGLPEEEKPRDEAEGTGEPVLASTIPGAVI